MIAVTLDTGALIAMERRRPRGQMLLRAAHEHRIRLVTTTPVIAEWWRGRTDERDRIKHVVDAVPLPVAAAESAGVVLGRLDVRRERSRLAIDVMIMAFASLYGGELVYTSDLDDLERLSEHYPSVRLLRI